MKRILSFLLLCAAVATVSCSKSPEELPVVDPVEPAVAVTGVELSKTLLAVDIGTSKMLEAKVTPENATNKEVIWKSDDPAVATVLTSGLIIGVAKGEARITATTVDGAKVATCLVRVEKQTVPVKAAWISKHELELLPGSKGILTGGATPSEATNKEVLWSSDNTSVATVSETGQVTAVALGTANITLTTAENGETASCVVTVSELFFDHDAFVNKELPANPAAADAWTLKFDVFSLNMDYHAILVDCGTDHKFHERNRPCPWAIVREYQDGTRTRITKTWEVVAQGDPNKGSEGRLARLFIVPTSVQIADLFGTEQLIDWDDNPVYDEEGNPVYRLKPEWRTEGVAIWQEAGK